MSDSKQAFEAYMQHVRKQSSFETLTAIRLEEPRPGGSMTWTFSAQNLLGMTLASVTFFFDWDVFDPPCRLRNERWGIKDRFTAPLFTIIESDAESTSIEKGADECEDNVMDGVRFDIRVTFEGPLNNVPYRNYLIIWADGTSDWGPR
ncbi:MAG TPA: hypothetical protein VIN77_14005 [Aurantimonas sp.]|uniref:Uncharacterized protein n=1 Tax=Aurantimonas marianensis TaxID=2920428 RepID=A0A9X2KJ16_9HYPH|nr:MULTISPECIES: hypothetical protein [Aurantimonas]MCP3056172.1 hypothetical protein [Aurantimonas marianensis]